MVAGQTDTLENHVPVYEADQSYMPKISTLCKTVSSTIETRRGTRAPNQTDMALHRAVDGPKATRCVTRRVYYKASLYAVPKPGLADRRGQGVGG